jgi:hypothetical protein
MKGIEIIEEPDSSHRVLTHHLARYRKLSLLASILIAALILTVVPGYATARPRDFGSTKTYLNALYRLLHVEQIELPVSKTNANELTSRVSRKCRGVVTSVHRTKQAALLNLEIGGALAAVMARPDRAQTVSFVRTVSALRWDDRRVADDVEAYVHKLTAEMHLTRVPNLCVDVMAWVRSGFQKVDPDSVRFVKEVRTADAGPEDVPRGILKGYEEPGESHLLQKIANAEKYLESSGLQALFVAWARLLKVVGL